jgi:transposase
MRGDEERQESIILFSSLEDRIPADHPLRDIRRVVDRALKDLSPLFDGLYHQRGRESIPPEYLLRAQLIQHLYAIPSERRLCEQLEYNLLLRWFVGLPLSEPVWHPTSFTKNRDRVLTSQVAEAFFAAVRAQAEAGKLLSREHFSCDGTLIEAAASLKSFRPCDEAHDDSGPAGPPAGRKLAWPRSRAKRPSSPIAGICSPRTATASSWTVPSLRPPAEPNRKRRFSCLRASARGKKGS